MNANHTLWYRQEASNWTDALPLGNGRIGAMLFGGTTHDRIGLNEDTLWTGVPKFWDMPEAYDAYRRAGELTRDGHYQEAQKLLEDKLTSRASALYMPLGDLLLDRTLCGEVTDYRRQLDLSTGIHTVQYQCDSVEYYQESFLSAPAQVLVIHMRASVEGALHFTATLTSQLQATVSTQDNLLIMDGICPNRTYQRGIHWTKLSHIYKDEPEEQGIRFRTLLTILPEGGTVVADSNSLQVKGADAVTLLLGVRTSFNGWDRHPTLDGKPYMMPVATDIAKAESCSYESLKAAHIADHQALYNRTELSLGGGEEGQLPTDERLIRHQSGGEDPALYALLFHFGRYLTIASSRAGTQPTNLQGIWNDRLTPPWASNYTININTEMNYWPTLVTNLTECYEPLLTMIQELRISGTKTAKSFYGARGFCAHHNTDLWRLTTPVGNGVNKTALSAFWPLSAGWFMRHLYEYWEYTQDETFLKETLLPTVSECAQFFLDVLQENKDGKLIFRPTTSPEHNFHISETELCCISDSSAMTQAIIRDVFRILLASAAACGHEDETIEDVRKALPKLLEYQLTSTGSIREWNEDFVPGEIHHRHLSHLYGFYPGREIDQASPLGDAVRQSLKERGDDGAGWCLSWKINMWARLRDGDHTLRLIDMLLRVCPPDASYPMPGGVYINLFDAHPPFQIDGNFGVCAGIAEMLLQGDAENPIFLPALPTSWKSGSVRGLRIRGGKTVDFSWENGTVTASNLY